MRILSIHIFSLHNNEPIILSSAFELSFVSIFQRGTLKEFLNFHSRLVIGRLQPEQNLEVQLEKGICYAVTNSDKLGATLICDEEYPKRVAIDLLLKLLEKVTTFIYQNKINVSSYTKDTNIKFTELDKTIQDAQNPEKIDNIVKIKSQLNEVQNIMKKNLDELLKREENLDNLMAKLYILLLLLYLNNE